MAEGLQVFLIKEKGRIATVWLDVIDIRCKCETPLLHALLAERVLRNKAITKLLPSIAIPPFCRRTLKSGPTRLFELYELQRHAFQHRFYAVHKNQHHAVQGADNRGVCKTS